MVEHDLAKVGVAGSSPVFRSKFHLHFAMEFFFKISVALVVELVDTQDLKSCWQQCQCGSDSRLGHLKSSSYEVKFVAAFLFLISRTTLGQVFFWSAFVI